MIVGAVLVLFFITIAPRIFRVILPPFTEAKGISVEAEADCKRDRKP